MGEGILPRKVLKDTFGRIAAIMPSVDTKLFVLPDQRKVYDVAGRQVIDGIDSPNGMVLGTSCEVPPLSYPANIHALVKAAEDYGSSDGE